MSGIAIALLAMLAFIIGFFSGAVVFCLLFIDQLTHEGEYQAGPFTIVGYVRRRNE